MTLPLELIETHPVILFLGSGGVGKTTSAAALAVAAAETGKRVVVLTIDPARRLADAMGLTQEAEDGGAEIQRQTNTAVQVEGTWPGELWASMLDPGQTFDDLIIEHASTTEQADRVLSNRLYKNLSTSLSGTNEYMAAEQLRSLHLDPRFDLVIVDTPPSRHAFDFLDSPGRLARFFDHRLYQTVLAPKKGVMKAANAATRLFVKSVSRLVGAALLEDVVQLFADMDGIDTGFRDRAAEVERLLVSPETAYVVVSGPRQEPLREARWISERLADRKRDVALLIVNRLTPRFDAPPKNASAAVAQNAAELEQLGAAEEAIVDSLAADVGAATALMLTEQSSPVADLDGLGALAEELATATYL